MVLKDVSITPPPPEKKENMIRVSRHFGDRGEQIPQFQISTDIDPFLGSRRDEKRQSVTEGLLSLRSKNQVVKMKRSRL